MSKMQAASRWKSFPSQISEFNSALVAGVFAAPTENGARRTAMHHERAQE